MKNKNFIIVGGTGGIGSVLTRSLAAQNSRLFIISKNSEKLANLKDEPDVFTSCGDISDSSFAKESFKNAYDSLGKIDGVVNLVGSIYLKPAHLTSEDDWDHTFNQNVKSCFNCLKYVIPHAGNPCSIVFMSSVAGVIGLQNHEAISAAKGAVIGLTKSGAATYTKNGIRINCIAPGLVETPLSERITSNASARQASTLLHPLGRIGTPSDVVPMIEFLLSDNSSWMTAQVIGVDGGLASIK